MNVRLLSLLLVLLGLPALLGACVTRRGGGGGGGDDDDDSAQGDDDAGDDDAGDDDAGDDDAGDDDAGDDDVTTGARWFEGSTSGSFELKPGGPTLSCTGYTSGQVDGASESATGELTCADDGGLGLDCRIDFDTSLGNTEQAMSCAGTETLTVDLNLLLDGDVLYLEVYGLLDTESGTLLVVINGSADTQE
jgi:hypothetical protein